MRIVVFGANGFIGEQIVHRLAARGEEVFAVVRPGSEPLFDDMPVKVLYGDLMDGKFVRAAVSGKDAVIFAAGRTWQPGLSMDEYRRQNVGMTQTLLAAVEPFPELPIVYTSSLSSIAGSRRPVVFAEDTGREPVCERLLTPYDRAKLEAEQLAMQYARRGRPVVVINPGLILGPGASERSKINNPFILLWIVQGKCPFYVDAIMSFCDVRDVAEAHIAALDRGRRGHRYLACGHNLLRSEFYAHMARLIGIRPPARLPCPVATGFTALGDALHAVTGGRFSSPFHRHFVRAQGLHYAASSQKAMDELGYRVRPIETTILDTLKHCAGRGLLPADLDFVRWITPDNAREVLCLRQLVRRHTFSQNLLPRLKIIYNICTTNMALRAALSRLLETSPFDARRARFRIRRSRCRGDLKKLNAFLDYLYFASDDFLAEVL